MRKYLLLMVSALICFTSCEDDSVNEYNVTFKVVKKEDNSVVANAKVLITNKSTAVTDTLKTDAQGLVSKVFEEGSYNLLCTVKEYNFVYTASEQNVAFNLDAQQVVVELEKATVSQGLIIKEVYYKGSRTPENKSYLHDQFVEIYNNSDEVVNLDGLCFGNQDESCTKPSVWVDDNGNKLDRIPIWGVTWMIPGSGSEHPLQPGESIVIARAGKNHKSEFNPNSPVDLGDADWEFYMSTSDKAVDYPGAANLNLVYSSVSAAMSSYAIWSSGPACIIFRLPENDAQAFVNDTDNFMIKPGRTSPNALMVHKDWVIDGVECIKSEAYQNKRLHNTIDAGFTFVNDYATSVRRKVKEIKDGRTIYQDTNNSTEDFIINLTPSPKVHPKTVD